MSNVFAAELLQGEVALVTGASRGIGAAIARALADAGATVVGTATSASGASAITEALGGASRGLVLDIANETSVQLQSRMCRIAKGLHDTREQCGYHA